MRPALSLAFAAILLAPSSSAQTAATGSIVGTVTDQSGDNVATAQVTLTDTSTGAARTMLTNSAGQYNFTSLAPGTYDVVVSHPSFRKTASTGVKVAVAQSTRLDVQLQLGQVTEQVTVTATAGAELQTVDSTIGNVVTSQSLISLPTVTRRANELIYLQVGAQPWANGGQNGSSGTVAGARSDQNQFLLDGLEVSDTQVGGSCCGNNSMGMPIPLESLEEFRAGVANGNATFGRGIGGAFSMTTRRGSKDYHGALYWLHQNDNVSANTWARNRLRQPRSALIDNRYGFRIGGPLFGNKWREKVFFFVNMEQRRFPQSTDISRLVPTDTMRQGILRFRDAAGNINSYNLRTSQLCGAANNLPCDPRGLGISPAIVQQFQLLPQGNDASTGDGLNTIGVRGPADTSLRNDNIIARLDYLLNDKWRFSGTWAWAQNRQNSTVQVDIRGGANNIKTIATQPNDPRMYNLALTGTVTPSIVNELRGGFFRSTIVFTRDNPRELVPGTGMALDLNGLDAPYDIGAASRAQKGVSDSWQLVDNLTWTKGRHIIQGGFNFQMLYFFHNRVEKSGINVFPQAGIGATNNVTIPATMRPPTCGGGVSANCILSADLARWNTFYADILGIVDNVNYFIPRDNSGTPHPGIPIENSGHWQNYQFNITDTWRISNALTLSLGLNFTVEFPFKEEQDRRSFLINQTTKEIIHVNEFLQTKADLARQGKIYNPGFAFDRITAYPGVREMPVTYSPAPRLALAWNPTYSKGWMGRLFGDRKSVIRAGYGLSYTRVNSTSIVQEPLNGNDLLGQQSIINGPRNASGDFFRVGVDGPAPSGAISPTIVTPYSPAIPFGSQSVRGFDPSFKLGQVHSVNLTIQREIPGQIVMEVGFLGKFARRLELPLNLNAVPFFIKDMSGRSNQTFAEAFDGVALQMRSGVTAANVSPQPFFENNVGPGGTTLMATRNPVGFINGLVRDLWLNTIDPALSTPVNNRQIRDTSTFTYGGYNNYTALFVQLSKRYSKGLTVTGNYTFSRNLGTLSGVQNGGGGSACFNPYNLDYCYGPQQSDRTHGLNAHGIYELPFGRGHKLGAGKGVERIVGDWSVSAVSTWFSGLPLFVPAGGQSFGAGGNESAPLIRDPKAEKGRFENTSGSGNVATAGDPARNGTGLNLFSDPAYVFGSFRRYLLSQDTGSTRGILRGLSRFTLDMSVAKQMRITERIKMRFTADFLNILNHPLFNDPSTSLDNPANFGVITSQPGNPGGGDFWAPRRVQFGLRLEF